MKVPEFFKTDPEDSGDSDADDMLRAIGSPINKSLEGCKEEETIFKNEIYKG